MYINHINARNYESCPKCQDKLIIKMIKFSNGFIPFEERVIAQYIVLTQPLFTGYRKIASKIE